MSITEFSNVVVGNLPDHFKDDDILNGLQFDLTPDLSHNQQKVHGLNKYTLSLGLVLKSRTGIKRLIKRQKWKIEDDNKENILRKVITYFATDANPLDLWTDNLLNLAADELAYKCVNLSPKLVNSLNFHPLYPPQVKENQSKSGILVFDEGFLLQVSKYHTSVERPLGTFAQIENVQMESSIEHLSALDREICGQCKGRRQVYCGDCGGLRMEVASRFLPPRISLPFDILLVVHWHESLHKCTGIHAAVLSEEHTVNYQVISKEDGGSEWESIVASLNPDSDVLLFPSEDAEDVDSFPWTSLTQTNTNRNCDKEVTNEKVNNNYKIITNNLGNDTNAVDPLPSPPNINMTTNATIKPKAKKWRLVVLEASWHYAKSMAKRLVRHRSQLGLLPLRCVQLRETIVGGYWRFHEEGNSAVSTIEAIASTAAAAGSSTDIKSTLLLLFNLQKYRVLSNVQHGGKPPRAMAVTGIGLGSWSTNKDLEKLMVTNEKA